MAIKRLTHIFRYNRAHTTGPGCESGRSNCDLGWHSNHAMRCPVQASFTRVQVLPARGVDCLLFQAVRPFSPSLKNSRLRQSLSVRERFDLALVAATKSSPFSIQFSQTARVHYWLRHPSSGSLRLVWLARTAVRFTTICLERWFPWSNSSVADSPKLLSPEQMEAFVQKVSIRTPGVQELIMVSKDRATLVFSQWQDRIRSRSAWEAPLALAVSLAVTLLTATFTDQPWIKAGTIKGMFGTVFLLACVWLVYEVIKVCRAPKLSAERFIEELSTGTHLADLSASTIEQTETRQ